MKIIFGVDLGGTQIKFGKFSLDKMIEKYSIDTDVSDNGTHIIPDICKSIKENIKDDELVGISIGVPGPVKNGIVIGAENINWGVINVYQEVRKFFPDVIIKVLNDANSALLGENYLGSAKGFSDVLMLTLGTGVGGGILINGKVYEGANGSSGEVGHICLEKNGRKCACGLYGCAEQYVSATGIVKTALEYREGKETLLNKDDLTCYDIFQFAKINDKVALDVVNKYIDDLAIICNDVATSFNPELILIGGGVSKAGDFLLNKLKEKYLEHTFYTVKDTKFALAILGNDAGIIGDFYAIRSEINE